MTGPALVLLVLGVAAADSPAPARAPAAGTFDVRSFGAKGDGSTDDSRAFQAALDAARSAGGGVVHVPAGTYVVAPSAAPKGGAKGGPKGGGLAPLTIGSNVWLRGDGPASVLKVKGGIGSYRSLLSNHPDAGSPVENVTISDLRFDQNCAASGGSVRVDGDAEGHFIVYLAWAGRNLSIERVRFDPICGVNTVVLNSPSARNVAVRDSYFRFVRGPAADPAGYDNTAVYLHGEGAAATGNVFESTAADGARGAIELHGSRGLAANNATRWYHSCVRVAGTSEQGESPGVHNGFTVTGNTCSDANDAINVWSVTRHHLRGVTISGNAIGLAERDHFAATKSPYFSGISFRWETVSGKLEGDIGDVVIEGNVITAQPCDGVWGANAHDTGGITLASAGNISNVVVRGNVLRDVPTTGIRLQSMGRGTKASNVRIEGNVLLNPGHDPSAGFHRAGIVVGGRLEDVEVAHNSIKGTMVPFRGHYAIHAAASPESVRVGVHDNLWSSGDPGAPYHLAIEGPVDTGAGGRTKSATLAPRQGDVLGVDGSDARVWDLTITGANGFSIRAPWYGTPGQRLTIRVRNGHSGPLGPVRWEGFKMGPWASPKPGHHRVLEVLWDGAAWSELSQSQDVPN